ncbi:MerR family transcriptional regulator [Streptomyces sp. NPDC047097]|uniref:MerR family transcriptional regulator n=1 Tax=Streptomyces sp. NPDC047097 TaxID=3155260 RepID=UPI0033EA98BC
MGTGGGHHGRHRDEQRQHAPGQGPRTVRAEQRPGRPGGHAKGYRSHDERFVDRVLQIRGLLDAGLPTRIIRQILPCLDKLRTIHFPDATEQMPALLERERARMDERIACLTRDRDAMAEYLDEVRRHRAPAPTGVPEPVGGLSC